MLQVSEIFKSISGEVGHFRQGEWVVFVRLAGCNLRCAWCDTTYAQRMDTGKPMTVVQVVEKVVALGPRRVVLTGGEPLLQDEAECLALTLIESGYGFQVQIETNGSVTPPESFHGLEPGEITLVVDYKLGYSGMTKRMIPLDQFCSLPRGSWVKMVIASRADYEQAVTLVSQSVLTEAEVSKMFSACPPLTHAELFRWMKKDRLDEVVLSVQIHKVCNLDEKQHEESSAS